MKKNRMMRLASGLLVAVLATTSVISGTYAKYTTRISGYDTARVAKFGVKLTLESDLFAPEYDGINEISVQAEDTEDVVAPGTTGSVALFSITGAPEVDVQVTASLNDESLSKNYTMVTLPGGEGVKYKDYTDVTEDKTFDLTETYYPVVWTLKHDGTEVVEGNLEDVQTYLVNTLSGLYNVESDEFSEIVGAYNLTWEWPFAVNDKADTYLGQIEADVVDAPEGHVANEQFYFNIEVTQVD